MKSLNYFLLLSWLVVACGCSKPAPRLLPPSEADQQFIKIMQEEFSTHALLKTVGKTLWIYIPGKKSLFVYKAKSSLGEAPQKKNPFSLQYIDGKFANQTFALEYDIINATKESASSGLTSGYTSTFNQDYSNTFGAIARVYLNSKNPPDFISLIFTDIINGVEISETFYLNDFRQYQASVLPHEEYLLRSLNETKGSPDMADDVTGRHIDYHDIAWGDFLVKQMIKRIEFKYHQSDFTPSNNSTDEILAIAKQTLDAYSFKDFNAVELRDLRNGVTRSFGQDVLADFPENKP